MAQDFFSQFQDSPSDSEVVSSPVKSIDDSKSDDFFGQFHTDAPVKKDKKLPPPTAAQLTKITTETGPSASITKAALKKNSTQEDTGGWPGLSDIYDAGAKVWDKANTPVVSLRSGKIKEATDELAKEHPILAGGANMVIDAISSLSSPLSVGLGALSGGAALADKLGAERLAAALKGPGEAASAYMMLHGGHSAIKADATPGERLGGIVEAGLGGLGFKRTGFSDASVVADDVHPTTAVEKPNLPPEFAQTVDEANQGRTATGPKSIDQLRFELAQNKFNMGKEMPDVKINTSKAAESFDASKSTSDNVTTESTTKTSNKPRYRLDSESGAFVPIDSTGKQTGPAQMPGKVPISQIPESQLPQVAEPLDVFKKAVDIGKMTPSAEKPGLWNDYGKPIYKALNSNLKTALTIWDLSPLGRQGRPMMANKAYWTSMDDMIKAWGSENLAKVVDDSIQSHPNFQSPGSVNGKPLPSIAERAGLSMGRPEGFETNPNWVERNVPIAARSERAFNAFIKKTRADTFNSLVNQAEGAGYKPTQNDQILKQLGAIVNDGTGSGSLGKLQKYAGALNEGLFAPRLMASRVNLYKRVLNPFTYGNEDPIVRRQVLKNLISTVGFGDTIGQLAKSAGAEVSEDPTNSDYKKIKIGPIRIDPYGGFQQYAVLIHRLFSGRSTSSTSGNITDLSNPHFGQGSRFDTGLNFLLSKLNPIPAGITAWAKGKEFDGTSFNAKKEAIGKTIPIVMQDIKDIYQTNPELFPGQFGKHPLATKIGAGAASIMGEGAQVYGR